jgi:hypothetical protein
MSKVKFSSKEEEYDERVTVVEKTTDLPYSFIPYSTVTQARINHPDDVLYVYEGQPAGYKIVAFPILMVKPEEGEDEQA